MEFFENDYTSKPSYVTINTPIKNNFYNITSGGYISLSFSLYDEFDNVVIDGSKYYSSILLKAFLIKKNETNEGSNKEYLSKQKDYILTGNVGSFISGNIILKLK